MFNDETSRTWLFSLNKFDVKQTEMAKQEEGEKEVESHSVKQTAIKIIAKFAI